MVPAQSVIGFRLGIKRISVLIEYSYIENLSRNERIVFEKLYGSGP